MLSLFRLPSLVSRSGEAEKFREFEEQYRVLFDKIPHPCWVIDTSTQAVVAVNDSAMEHYGYTREEFSSLRLSDICADTNCHLRDHVTRAPEKPASFPVKHKGKSGAIIETRADYVPTSIQGRIVGLLSLQTPWNTNDELHKEEARFRDLVENTSDLLWETDEQGYFNYCSPNVLSIFGYTAAEMIGRRPTDFMPAADAERIGALINRFAAERRPFYLLTHRIVRKDGRLGFLECSGTPVLDSQGRLKGYRGVDRDISERKHVEELLAQRMKELRATNQRMLETERLKDAFFANVSHELRTPLTLILAPLESLLSGHYGELARAQTRVLSTMHNNAVRLLQMLTGLLDFARLEANKVEINPEPLCIVKLTHYILEDFRPLMEQKKLDIQFQAHPPQISVRLDRYLYERIAFNLLSNAVKYTPPGGRIGVSLRWEQDRLRLSVQDTGIGIHPDEVKHLFEKFRQFHVSSTRRFEGTGLGLALVKEFAALLGGSVDVHSEFGKGSTFVVELAAPRAEAPAEDFAPGERKAIELYQQGIVGPTELDDRRLDLPKVLIAEDNAELTAFVTTLLNGFCRIKAAKDGSSALEIARAWLPDVLLSDVMMPNKSGLELCKELKSDPRTADILVVMLTAMTNRQALLEGWEAGADEYLFKPFHPQELVTRVRSLLRASYDRRMAKETEILKAKERYQMDFVANVSHEFRTPIAAISGFAETLLRGGLDDRRRRLDFVKTIARHAKRLSLLVEDLLSISALEVDKKRQLRPKPVLLATFLREVTSSLRPLTRGKQVILRSKVEPGLRLLAQKHQLYRIFQNLIENAIKFSPKGAVILIEAHAEKENALISVRDHGIGIPQEELPLVFDRFHRAHPDFSQVRGTGLGLSIVKQIVEGHGGTIWVESAEGKGSTFHFTLPLAEPAADRGDAVALLTKQP